MSKKQRLEHLEAEMNRYCQIIRKVCDVVSRRFQGETERKEITIKQGSGNKFKINKWFSFRFVSIWKSTTLNTEKLVIKELWEGKEMDRNRKRENKQGKCHSTTNGCAEHIVPKHYVIRQ